MFSLFLKKRANWPRLFFSQPSHLETLSKKCQPTPPPYRKPPLKIKKKKTYRNPPPFKKKKKLTENPPLKKKKKKKKNLQKTPPFPSLPRRLLAHQNGMSQAVKPVTRQKATEASPALRFASGGRSPKG